MNPRCFLIQFGIFTVPISSHWRWCVQPSAIRILSCSRIESIAAAPETARGRLPLYLAIKMEKDVKGISLGKTLLTLPKIWLSVMTSFGGADNFSSVETSSVSLQTIAFAPASRISRMVCCWGKISLPLGAALSIGTTRTTTSPTSSISEMMRRLVSSLFASAAQVSRSSWMPVPCFALTQTASLVFSGTCVNRSDLFQTIRWGIFRSFAASISRSSASLNVWAASTTMTARSALFNTCFVFDTRSAPSSPSSSIPGVSMIITGPTGSSSMAL